MPSNIESTRQIHELKETPQTSVSEVVVAEPHGVCRGAESAIDMANLIFTIVDGREPVYTHNPFLHNERMMEEFKRKGLVIIEDRTPHGDWDHTKVPNKALYVIPAHGGTPSDTRILREKECLTMDLTCPLVDAEHNKVKAEVERGKHVLLFGKKNHPEPRGTIGSVPQGSISFVSSKEDLLNLDINPTQKYVWANQTTQSTREIIDLKKLAKERIPDIRIAGRGQGCYATDERQDATVDLAKVVDAFLVVTSALSNNGTNLVKRAAEAGIPSYLIQGVTDLRIEEWFPESSDIHKVGITSAASTPENYLDEVITSFEELGVTISHQSRTNTREPNPFTLKRANIEGLCARYGVPVPIMERHAI
jgi:4-hydroxy-3-methylbut-2-en-1-yl diphosphate reductase